eukprot:3374769-Amphidinium_carterae.2
MAPEGPEEVSVQLGRFDGSPAISSPLKHNDFITSTPRKLREIHQNVAHASQLQFSVNFTLGGLGRISSALAKIRGGIKE